MQAWSNGILIRYSCPTVTSQTIAQINDGSPAMVAVAELNTLLGKNRNPAVFWENIGSKIAFTLLLATAFGPLRHFKLAHPGSAVSGRVLSLSWERKTVAEAVGMWKCRWFLRDLQGLWECWEACFRLSRLSIARHFHGYFSIARPPFRCLSIVRRKR